MANSTVSICLRGCAQPVDLRICANIVGVVGEGEGRAAGYVCWTILRPPYSIFRRDTEHSHISYVVDLHVHISFIILVQMSTHHL